MDSIRQKKVSNLIKRELSEIFLKDIRDYFTGVMVSITNVSITSDLSFAKIYISVFPSEKRQDIFQKINDISYIIKSKLVQKIAKQVRVIPELKFIQDDTLDYMDQIDELLKK